MMKTRPEAIIYGSRKSVSPTVTKKESFLYAPPRASQKGVHHDIGQNRKSAQENRLFLVWHRCDFSSFLVAGYSMAGSGTLTVSGTQWGVTSHYLGANEGSSQFNINDLADFGIDSYRLYGGMSRWEPTNDSSTYGSPSIAQIEADPNVINGAFCDNIMTNPPGGSDYSWSASTGIPPVSAATIIGALNAHNITPIIVLRNRNNNGNPAWSPNPPLTTNDWNEWWEHVFATVYWFNLRNNYVVDNWEVHNEPNSSGQGWGGTESQYMTFLQYTANAIHWVYGRYLPGRIPHIYAPVTSNCCSWALTAMQTEGPSVFDSLDFHDYRSNPSENHHAARRHEFKRIGGRSGLDH
jgi:hypothetical protein